MADRPYANGHLPSVTQVLSLLSAPGLSWGAARETATYAVHHQDEWSRLQPADAIDRLYKHHRGVWDHRALLGTAVHHINAEWCQGREVRVADVIDQMRSSSPLWRRMPETDIYRDLLPMTNGLARVWDTLKPETQSWEQVVRYTNSAALGLDYVGTTDWRVTIEGRPILLDLKTTGKRIKGKGKYWDQWRLQLAAYRYATEALIYEGLTLKGAIELPEVDGCAIVHLYGDGQFEVDGIEAGPAEHDIFLRLRQAYSWRERAKNSPGRDLPVIVGAPA